MACNSRALLAIGSGAREVYGPFQLYPSRAYFRAYTHTVPLLDVSGERQGAVPIPAVRPTNGTTWREHLLEQTRRTLLALDRPAGPTCLSEHRDCGSQFIGPTAHALVQVGAADLHFLGAMTGECDISYVRGKPLSAQRFRCKVTVWHVHGSEGFSFDRSPSRVGTWVRLE
jgi:hypothetical protein